MTMRSGRCLVLRSRPTGFTVVELVVALVLGAMIGHMALQTLGGLHDAGRRLAGRQDEILSARIVRTALRAELAYGVADRDWVADGDSITLRAFRGGGAVCSVDPSEGVLVVAYAGLRRPEPAKDSVEVVTERGVVVHVDLTGDAPSAAVCPLAGPDEELRAWRLEGRLPDDAVGARIYERGVYHVAGASLRYRIGAGGRQPLTPDVWDAAGTGLRVDESAIAADLAPTDARRPHWFVYLAPVRGR